MSSKQHRNLHANPAEAEALESLQHMTSRARQTNASPESRPGVTGYGSVVDGFALGAAAFHPGAWDYPADGTDEANLGREEQPRRPSIEARAVRAIGGAMLRFWRHVQERRAASRAAAVLSQMDDRSLQDIGISRADIGRAARLGRDWERWH